MRPGTGRVGVGLAGLGRMGRVHAANLASRCAVASLAGVYDADPGVAGRVAAETGVAASGSFGALLADPGVAAVAIAAPTGEHARLCALAARAGKPVFCEKPVSLSRQATLDTLAAVDAAGVPFQVGFHRRFDPDWAAAAARIRAGELGDVYLFRTSLRDMAPPPAEFLARSGGFFVDMTIHDLDTARWLVGEIVEVTARGTAASGAPFTGLGDIDTAVVVLRFESGALGVIDNSRVSGYGYECSTEVMGRHATVRIGHSRYRHYEWLTPGRAEHDLPRDFEQRYPEAYAAELDAFARCVRDGTPPQVTGWDALAAYDLARAADLSWRTGRTVRAEPRRTAVGVVYRVPDDGA